MSKIETSKPRFTKALNKRLNDQGPEVSDNKKQPCPVCGDILEYSPSGFLTHYHDHKDLRYWKEMAEGLEKQNAELKEMLNQRDESLCNFWADRNGVIERFNSRGEDYRLAIKELLTDFYLYEAAKWVSNHANASSSSSSSSHIVI